MVGKRSGGQANVAPQRHDGVQRRRRLGGGMGRGAILSPALAMSSARQVGMGGGGVT